MKFRIRVSDGSSEWWESFDENITNAQQWAADTIQSFNDTLRLNELPRTLLDVEVVDVDTRAKHDWVKTNLTTIIQRGRIYDSYRCTCCGITGKRHGIGGLCLDPKFARAKVYRRCDTAEKHLRKLHDESEGE